MNSGHERLPTGWTLTLFGKTGLTLEMEIRYVSCLIGKLVSVVFTMIDHQRVGSIRGMVILPYVWSLISNRCSFWNDVPKDQWPENVRPVSVVLGQKSSVTA